MSTDTSSTSASPIDEGRLREFEEIIRSDMIAETERNRRLIKPSGALDGPLTRANVNAYRRMRQRAIDLYQNGIEPVPDRETGLGAWGPLEPE